VFSPSRYQSIHYSQFQAAASSNPGDVPQYLIWVRSCPITRSRSLEISAASSACSSEPGQKRDMRQNRVDRAPFSRNRCTQHSRKTLGEEMATIPMIPVGPATTLHRSILLTERGMSGNGGDDFICGHCGSVMLEDFDPSTVRGNPVYQCGFCENNNDLPFAASDGRHWPSR
jgi:hypothetical protein